MFLDNPDRAPISMIITNLAAHAYEGQTDIGEALVHIVTTMPNFVRSTRPRVPNPTDPSEDYADRWATNPVLEDNFWAWHQQVTADLGQLAAAAGQQRLQPTIKTMFDVELTKDEVRTLEPPMTSHRVVVAAPAVVISSAPRPWGNA
jgi:hypothetical protein